MNLEKGQKAPDFKVNDIFGNEISLKDYNNKKLLISFFRYASCIFCNLRIHQLIQKYDELSRRGLEIISFFQSPKESILEFVGKQDAPFPIIADPDRSIYKKYHVEESNLKKFIKGVAQKEKLNQARDLEKRLSLKNGKVEGNRFLVPADFLVSENQIILQAYYGKDISDHLPIEEIEKFLD
ncbi:MAG: peroxiredoxin-like family protein [Candidatus Humimicrobiaceae bacterium]